MPEQCVSCRGLGVVLDIGADVERPCSLCRKVDYARWVEERQPATRSLARLDDAGRCCGRKPRPYKRPHHFLICLRCCAEFDPATGTQQANWAWQPDGDAFVARNPTSDYAREAIRSRGGEDG